MKRFLNHRDGNAFIKRWPLYGRKHHDSAVVTRTFSVGVDQAAIVDRSDSAGRRRLLDDDAASSFGQFFVLQDDLLAEGVRRGHVRVIDLALGVERRHQ